MQSAQDRYMIAKRRMDADHRVAQAFSDIRDGMIKGDWNRALAAFERHKHFHNIKKRTKKQIKETQEALAVKNPAGGICKIGNCCVSSYKDLNCKVPYQKMCRNTRDETMTSWKKLTKLVGEASFMKELPKEHLVKANRTAHINVRWTKIPAQGPKGKPKMALEAQICGKFTKWGKEGNTVCFPQNSDGSAKGMQIGELYSAPRGTCVRTSDFAEVVRKNVMAVVQSGAEVIRKKAKAQKKETGPSKQLKSITEAVSRAIGGVFKGTMGGVTREADEADELDSEMFMSFLQETTTADWEEMLEEKGSFHITNVATKADFGVGAEVQELA